MTVLAWHFLADSGKLRDGQDAPPDGKRLLHRSDLEMCCSGLHASIKPLDALKYAPGSIACRVKCGGQIEYDKDKLVCSCRTIVWRVNATEGLRRFARRCALDVIDHWDAPKVVREYLETRDGAKRAAAWDAASDAARAAASAAARDRYNDWLEEEFMVLAPPGVTEVSP